MEFGNVIFMYDLKSYENSVFQKFGENVLVDLENSSN